MRLQVADTALDLIGDTPLLHLRSFDAPGGAAVFAKLEFLNPGGSPQDRTALGLIQDAETRGRLRPGATLIDAGTGNAGIGLALVGARRGYRTIVVVPEDASAEKRALARALGATVVTTPASEGMEGSLARARAIAAETPGSFLPERFDNPANAEIHYRTTGREIWQQMQGRIDALVVGAASGGTFTGVARYLKERHPGALAVLVESEGSVLGGGSRAAHRVDEIGSPFFPAVLERSLVDEVIAVGDRDAYATAARLARREGLLAGCASGAAAFAAATVARRLGAGRRVVTLFADSADRYLSQGIYDEVT